MRNAPGALKADRLAKRAFYEGLATELLGQFGRLGTFTKHAPSVGKYHEALVKSCIASFLSNRFSVRTGFAYMDEENVSAEGDILVIDESDPSPYLFRENDLVVVHPRALACVIQVKTRLLKRDFSLSIHNLCSFKQLRTDRNFPVTLLFAFEGTKMSLATLDKWYKDIDIADEIFNYPHVIFSLNHGTLIFRDKMDSRSHGHYFVMGEEGERRKVQGLSIFLSTVRKAVEAKAGLDTNPYEEAFLDGLQWSRQGLRFGVGNGTNGSE